MADAPLPAGPGAPADQASSQRRKSAGTFARISKYTLIRVVALFITVVIGVYITVLIANMGGYVDEIRRGVIREQVAVGLSLDPEFRQLPPDVRRRQIEEVVRIQEERFGLDRPFLLRSFGYLASALTLDLGRAEQLISDSGSRQVRLIILERLPPTLYLFATANLILFFLSLFVGLYLSRRYGSFLDKAIIALAPTSAAPSWFYGIFLILIFAALWGVLPFGGMVATPPPREPLDYALSLLRHLILPVTAFVVSAIFLTIYSWRTFFLIYSSEDYVEMAKAKGLPDRTIERRYVLRPTLPYIVTSFALTLIALWQGAIVLETVFNWPGLGRLLFQAIVAFDIPVIVGSTVIYAYLLALTVFLLDIIYALLDPRVKVGGGASV
jgi:peptide/nickel transport system permease protein